MMIAICTPSRGLIFSKTVECITKGMQALSKLGVATTFITCHDLPIPDCHNFCVSQALQDPNVSKVLFIEEDNFVFEDCFIALATSSEAMVTVQYNDKNGSPHGIIHYNESGEILWSGLGATAIKREVFEKLGEPYFRTDTRYKITKQRDVEGKLITEYEELETKSEYQYGGLDVDFFTRARKAGYKMVELTNFRGHHLQLIKLGEPYTNKGMHEIRQV